ncbi:MAG: acetylxylan esterase [Clostridiales bacterium]|jgi:cephalosporin-C deacetylase|nr:acetylxylan esterase [Clostridiales bacterium]
MPLVDMPLEKLKEYRGINPCPSDIDEYWDMALLEMNNLAPDVSLVPAKFKVPAAECFDLYFTGVKGARIHAKFVRPKAIANPVPAVLEFHGYSGSAGDWAHLLTYAGQGCCIAAMDCRGQAGGSEDVGGVKGTTLRGHIIRGLGSDDPHDLLFRHIFLDTAQLAKIVMDFPEVDEKRVFAKGGSQGGGLTIACAALEPRIRKAAPMYPFLSDYRRVWQMDLAVNAYEELKKFFRNFDPRHEREEEIFTKLGYVDIKNIAKRIKAEVLMATGLMDTICPPSTQFAAYNRIVSPKNVVIYPDFGHERLPDFDDMTMAFLLGA